MIEFLLTRLEEVMLKLYLDSQKVYTFLEVAFALAIFAGAVALVP